MRVVLSGGGTGGHIYPALAVQKNILAHYPDAEFLYIGT
ncbi:glycosyltransferase, partial [Streptococcus agalactiae]